MQYNIEQRGRLDIEQCTVLYRAALDIIILYRPRAQINNEAASFEMTSSEVVSCAIAAVLVNGSVLSTLVTKHGLVSTRAGSMATWLALWFNVIERARYIMSCGWASRQAKQLDANLASICSVFVVAPWLARRH